MCFWHGFHDSFNNLFENNNVTKAKDKHQMQKCQSVRKARMIHSLGTVVRQVCDASQCVDVWMDNVHAKGLLIGSQLRLAEEMTNEVGTLNIENWDSVCDICRVQRHFGKMHNAYRMLLLQVETKVEPQLTPEGSPCQGEKGAGWAQVLMNTSLSGDHRCIGHRSTGVSHVSRWMHFSLTVQQDLM